METKIEGVEFTSSRAGNRIGYAKVILKTADGLALSLDGIVIYQVDEKLHLSYPKRDKKRDLNFWHPVNAETAKKIEEAVFGELLLIQNLKLDPVS